MLRALIVDDDEIFARYVKKCIDWDGLHTQLLGHAETVHRQWRWFLSWSRTLSSWTWKCPA